MSVEELLKPRYKVIADMPVLPFKVGEIYNADFVPIIVLGKQEYVRLDLHPHLFRKLEWWEERDEKDLPKYVKNVDGKVHEVYKFYTVGCFKRLDTMEQYATKDYLPATEQEYLNYINKTYNENT